MTGASVSHDTFVRFRVGRVEAEVSEEDAQRLIDHLLARGTSAAVRAAVRIMAAEEAA